MFNSIVSIILVILVLLFAFFTIWYQQTLGNKSSDYHTICIEKHEYYRASFLTKGFLGIKLDDNGKPVSCGL